MLSGAIDVLRRMGFIIPTAQLQHSIEETGWRNPVREDQKLTDHFSLYELTRTDHADLQDQNRILDDLQVGKLKNVALLHESIRILLGDVAVIAHSGYRCPQLNAAVGSSIRSQHLLCEALDWSVHGIAVDETFRKLRQLAKDKKFSFGQLIYEKANRGAAVSEWVHLSLGTPYRDAERCGQILTMLDGQYTLLDQVS